MSSRNWFIWALVVTALLAPALAASFSPQLAWRRAPYIVAGFAGILALSLMVLQPLLGDRLLPGIRPRLARALHRASGVVLLGLVVAHVYGLWLTSAPDVIDALLLRSPTAFSIWGVLALGAIGVVGLATVARRRLKLRARTWRRFHVCFAAVAVLATVFHAALIEGTMEPITKIMICALALVTTGIVVGKSFRSTQ